MQHAWLESDPVDLVVIGFSGGGKEVRYIMPLDLPGWTCHLDPLCPECNYGPEGGVTGGGSYCDLLADWSVPTALTYFDASEQTFLVAQLTNTQCACACQMDFIPTHGDHNIVLAASGAPWLPDLVWSALYPNQSIWPTHRSTRRYRVL
jgi:hypothetical protein